MGRSGKLEKFGRTIIELLALNFALNYGGVGIVAGFERSARSRGDLQTAWLCRDLMEDYVGQSLMLGYVLRFSEQDLNTLD